MLMSWLVLEKLLNLLGPHLSNGSNLRSFYLGSRGTSRPIVRRLLALCLATE